MTLRQRAWNVALGFTTAAVSSAIFTKFVASTTIVRLTFSVVYGSTRQLLTVWIVVCRSEHDSDHQAVPRRTWTELLCSRQICALQGLQCRCVSCGPCQLRAQVLHKWSKQGSVHHHVGDVVLAEHPKENKQIVKRIIAKGGTTLCAPMPEDCGQGVHVERFVHIPDDHVWLAGDNMSLSYDSRDYGPVPSKNLLGRVVMVVSCSQTNSSAHAAPASRF
jgi:hypothetical protein